jgi:hypothetical protein
MAIDNEPTIARSDRFTRTVSHQPVALRVLWFAKRDQQPEPVGEGEHWKRLSVSALLRPSAAINRRTQGSLSILRGFCVRRENESDVEFFGRRVNRQWPPRAPPKFERPASFQIPSGAWDHGRTVDDWPTVKWIHLVRPQPISAKFYRTEATKTASESEPKFLILSRFLPRKELKNRGHLRLHAGATTRALR